MSVHQASISMKTTTIPPRINAVVKAAIMSASKFSMFRLLPCCPPGGLHPVWRVASGGRSGRAGNLSMSFGNAWCPDPVRAAGRQAGPGWRAAGAGLPRVLIP
ncbi:hypothetical protein GCM10009779_10950 [Polymorphospora rubra]|uniref:Uncharacterized protein n=1 Tax=Polymorphospora rubra TaxID=338584 RepID=A0A810N7X4_9ACTN|nr:hypothetical protein Prubr_61410 [Polymorphospora rubra]